ncbi:MAG TPA: class I SAM-dependent methyltransferase, partial [Thermoanaerobaculia bacterium]|nr:class I SAM-dependent methyltransferase [Thermoanaerobaculia bacterium]
MLAYRAAERHPLVESYLATQVPAPLQPAREIAAGDFMLRFFLEHRHGHRDLALVDYFQSGWSLARTLRQVLAWRWGEHLPGRVLDFACGFGRGTRYLVRLLPAETVTVADIFAEAVAFQRQLLGVRGFVSAADPGVVRCE